MMGMRLAASGTDARPLPSRATEIRHGGLQCSEEPVSRLIPIPVALVTPAGRAVAVYRAAKPRWRIAAGRGEAAPAVAGQQRLHHEGGAGYVAPRGGVHTRRVCPCRCATQPQTIRPGPWARLRRCPRLLTAAASPRRMFTVLSPVATGKLQPLARRQEHRPAAAAVRPGESAIGGTADESCTEVGRKAARLRWHVSAWPHPRVHPRSVAAAPRRSPPAHRAAG